MTKPINVHELAQTVKASGVGFGGINRAGNHSDDESSSEKDYAETLKRIRASIKAAKRIDVSKIPDWAVENYK